MMSSLAAALRRICMPKPASGKLEVSQEIHRQFKAGGQQRKCLLDMLVKSKGNKEVFLKTIEHQQKKSRKNNLHVEKGFYTKANMKKDLGWDADRIKAAVKYCADPRRAKTHVRRDKYQSHIKEYWVDVQTTGSFDDENEETFVDKTTGEGQAASFDLGLPATDPCAAARGEDEPEPVDTDHEVDDDMDDGTSSRMSRTRVPPRSEVQKEHALEAIENVGTVMSQLLKVQSRMEIARDKLSNIDGNEAQESMAKVEKFRTSLMKLHDELADLKSFFDGHMSDDAFDDGTILKAPRAASATPKAKAKSKAAPKKRSKKAAPVEDEEEAPPTTRGRGGESPSAWLPSRAGFPASTVCEINFDRQFYLREGIKFDLGNRSLQKSPRPPPEAPAPAKFKSGPAAKALAKAVASGATWLWSWFWGYQKLKLAPLPWHFGKSFHTLFVHNFADYGLAADIPLSFYDVGLKGKHPALALSDIVKCFDQKNKLEVERGSAYQSAYIAMKVGTLLRHFGRQVKSGNGGGHGICHLCQADRPSFENWHDVSWANMCKMHNGCLLPWVREPGLLAAVPIPDEYKAEFFRFDIFHALHKGLMADMEQLFVMLPVEYQVCCFDGEVFGAGSFERLCDVCFAELKEFCRSHSMTLHMSGLTRTLLGFMRSSDYPTGNWFKGADTVCILAFLESRIAELLADLDDSAKSLFSEIYEMIAAAHSFMRCIYHSALWLTSDERDHLLISGHKCVNYFHKCAQRAFDAHVTRWKYMPKIHLFGEILFFLERDKRRNIPSLNPLSFCTQQDEDFVGRIAVLSRAVSVRTVHSRTIGRYLVSLASSW
ncbi:unnamed protein product [Cladocopium goreaui]|uniref:Uncharacterized protein n=1 Tax=Cladocopium goreaui TaxID=2562237 RepID=A0A9P1C235_9DINO|nr:unnamed protein product [Cladocopium goreaui]